MPVLECAAPAEPWYAIMRLYPLTILALSLGAAACDKVPWAIPPAASAATRLPLPPEPEQAAPAPVARAATPDLDAVQLGQQLGCSGNQGRRACRVLAEFAQAARWSAQTPSGEGRWFGRAYTVEKGAEKSDLMILLAKNVPTSQIGPGDLPIRIAMGSLPEDASHEGAKLVASLSRSNNVSKTSKAVAYVRSFSSQNERGAVTTAGSSVRLISEDAVYVRQGAGQKLLVVRASSGPSASPGDGTYAELWATTW